MLLYIPAITEYTFTPILLVFTEQSCFPYRDTRSYISQNGLGLGRAKSDEVLMPFIPVPLSTDMRYKVTLPDGIPFWVKLHLTVAGIHFYIRN